MNDYLSYFHEPATGLFHGSLHRNRPTPSGCTRYVLAFSTKSGRRLPGEAIAEIARAFPEADRPDPGVVAAHDTALAIPLRRGHVVTRILAKSGPEAGTVSVEVRHRGALLPIALSEESLTLLVATGRLRLDSTSGDDPELRYAYNHYEVVLPEGGQHEPKAESLPPPAPKRCERTLDLFAAA